MSTRDPRSILAATELGEGGEEVVRTAGALAAATGAELHVLHAFEFTSDPYPGIGAIPGAGFQDRVHAAERALEEQVRRAVPEGVAVAPPHVVIDTAARAVLNCAAGTGADLIVLGPHRGRGLEGVVLGSTADRVVRVAEAPCLIARGRLRVPLQHVLVPMDLSAPSRGALRLALDLARALGGQAVVEVVHVIPRIFAGEDFPFSEASVGPELHREVEAVLGPAAERAEVELRECVVWGDSVPDEILRVAEERRADLVVMGTQGRGPLMRALLGSVAATVSRRAACPVLLVPPAMDRENG